MLLPDQVELLKLFSSFLFEAGLSAVSVKNYLSDLRHFLAFCTSPLFRENIETPTVKDIFQHIDSYLENYLQTQKATFTPASTTARRLASIRRFSTFLSVKFGVTNRFTAHTISKNIDGQNHYVPFLDQKNVSSQKIETHQTTSSSVLIPSSGPSSLGGNPSWQPARPAGGSHSTPSLSSEKILEQFKSYLEKEKKSHSTVKNYLSDLNHFFLWTAKQTPFSNHNLVSILSEHLLSTYVTYLKLSHTSTSVINRRQSSIKKLTKFCFEQGYIPQNPFEIRSVPQSLAPLAWIERLSHRKNKLTTPRGRLARAYDRYNALPWTPYLNLALLVLATTAMAIFAYNQIISQASPSAAATALTPPKRQLSFQGRLTDSGGTPITTAVSVVFKLFNQLAPPGTQLYTSGTCSITPDQDGIFNTLIGDGVCGAEINSSVFTDNRDVFLEITIGAETLTPRQQIATVGFALNSETLQGYPASASATINTVPVVDNDGNINISASSPSIISNSGTFSIEGQSLALTTSANSGGDIILQPDAIGSGQILALGGTTTEDSFRITNANLTSGSLISGYVGNDTATGRLISLTSGSTETDRFWVATDGRTSINATATNSAFIVNQIGSGNLISASVSGTPVFTVTNGGNVDITGQYLVNGVPIGGGSSNWQLNSGALTPLQITNSVNIGAIATSAAYVHLAGTSGENSFINTGNFGIGNTSPSEKLDVTGNALISGDVGIGTTGPDAKLDVLSTIEQLRLTYADGVTYSSHTVDISGNLTINNTGTKTIIADDLQVSGGDILDSNGNESLRFGTTAAAVDEVTITNAATGGTVTLAATGDDGDIALSIDAKGSDPLNLNNTGTGDILIGGGSGSTGCTITNATGALSCTVGISASSIPFSGITSATNTTAAMVVGTGASLDYSGSGTINASSLGGATFAAPGAIGGGTAGSGSFTTLTSSGNTTLGTGASSINTIGSTTTPGTLTLHGATTLDNTFTVSGANLTSLGGDLLVTGTASISGALTLFGTPTINTTSNQPLTLSAADTIITGRTTLNSLSYTWPASHTTGGVLQNDGAGTLTWATIGAASITPDSLDFTEFKDAMTLDATTDVAMAGFDFTFSGTGDVGIGLTNPAYKLDVNGDIHIATGSDLYIGAIGLNDVGISNITSGASLIGVFDEFANSSSTTVQDVLDDLDAAITAAVTNDQFWASDNGALYPKNSTLDLLIGGQSTASAKFAVLNMASGTPVASISANTAGNATYLSGDGILATTNKQSLTLGSTSTGNINIGTDATARIITLGNATTTTSLALNSGTGDIILTSTDQIILNSSKAAGGTTTEAFSIKSTVDLGAADEVLQIGDSAADMLTILGNGNVGIGVTNPVSTLSIGTGSLFQVNSTGNIVKINNVTTSFPASQGAANSTLTNDGAGNLSWFSPMGGSGINGYWQRTDGSLAPTNITDSLNLGSTATASALVHLAGTAAENSWINTGNVGIGDTTPLSLFTVGSGDLFQVNSSGAIAAVVGITNTGIINSTGGIIDLNVSSNFATNINTGSSTGTVIIGGGLNTVAVDSTSWDISNTGVASGFTGFTSSGTINFSGLTPSRAVFTDASSNLASTGNSAMLLNTLTDETGTLLAVFSDAPTFTTAISIDNEGDLRLLEADANGSSYTGFKSPASLAANLIYTLPTAQGAVDSTLTNDGSGNLSWFNPTGSGTSGFWQRNSQALSPTNITDSVNLGSTATSSALVHLSGSNDDIQSFFLNPLGIGFNAVTTPITNVLAVLETEGHILPHTDLTYSLGSSTQTWTGIYVNQIADDSGTLTIDVLNNQLTNGDWKVASKLRVGSTVAPTDTLDVTGTAAISSTLSVGGTVTVGGGTGKIDVGTVDPPYTINGEKYATYLSSTIGIKEEVMGKINVSESVNGVGYRTLIDLDAQPKGSDLWLFSKTTNLKENIDQLSVLLTPSSQAKTWYEVDPQNNILAIYSSTPTDIVFRLSAPRFDSVQWTNTRISEIVGFVINDPENTANTPNTGLLNPVVLAPELIALADNSFILKIDGQETKEVSSFFQSIIANLQVGTQTVTHLLAQNLTIRNKLISPIADIDQLKVIDATVSGTLYADNIKSKTVDNLTLQLDLLNEKYSTASAILSDLQAKYTSYDSLFGEISAATISGDLSAMADPLTLSPLATTSAILPSDLALNSLSVHTIYSNDLLANGSVFTQSLSSFESDLYIQPTGDKAIHLLANLMTLYPDGKVVVNGDFLITGILYAAGLDTRTATVSGTLAVGSSTIASDSANFDRLTTNGLVIASGNDDLSATMSAATTSNTTIGTATIASNSAEIAIANNKVTHSTLIYLTPISDTSNQVLYLKSKQSGIGFTVAIPASLTSDVSFNYWLVETK